MSCNAMHDWVTQEDHTGYEWSECAQCGAVEHEGYDDSEDRTYDYED